MTPTEEPRAAHPERVGPYEIVEVLGEGGMGAVYLAQQREPLERQVALKVIKPGRDTREVLARFEIERQALSLMSHSSIAKVYDAGATPEGRPFFVMEYVPGVPVTTYCDEHGLTIAERLAVFISICEAVHHAHQKGIIHRDLKPSNVLVGLQDGRALPKVIDFGLALATEERLSDGTVLTEAGVWIGTPEYMSPEQAGQGSLGVDTRADIYSLGVLLYELLTGHLPFDSAELREAGLLEIQRRIQFEEPPKPSTKVSTVSGPVGHAAKRGLEEAALCRRLRGDLDWITMKALAKEPVRRYDSAIAFADDLRRHLAHEPVRAGPPGTGYVMRKFLRKNRGFVAASAAVIMALAAGLGVALWQYAEARDRGELLRQAAESERMIRADLEAEKERRNALFTDNLLVAETALLGSLRREGEAFLRGTDLDGRIVGAWVHAAIELGKRLNVYEAALLGMRGNGRGSGEIWSFADGKAQFRHDTLARFVADLRRFGTAEAGLLARVLRTDFVRGLLQNSNISLEKVK